MKFQDANRLLEPAPMALETGWERLEDGVLHVACRTDLHNCRGEMFEWWFRSRPNTQHYIWWHPLDHVSSEWIVGPSTTHIDSIHKVEESFSGSPVEKLLIQFRDPEEFFDAGALRDALAMRHLSAAICGRGGHGWEAPKDPQGRILGTRLLHVCRDTDWGCVLRSHFFLGQDLPMAGKSAEEVAAIIPDKVGPALIQHCYNEFTFLSRFLPSLFVAENRSTHPVVVPW